MAHYTHPLLARLTAFFSDQNIEHAARHSGFVKRASKITGEVFVALMTFGLWSKAHITLAQLAAKATLFPTQLDISPEALHQRLNPAAVRCLKELLRQAFAALHQAKPVAIEPALAPFSEVHLIDSTGFALPERLSDSFPGAAGSASKAGAKIQLSWAYLSHRFAHFALTPLNVPDSKYVAELLTLAHHKALLIFDLGYVKLDAFAKIIQAKAFFVSRLHHWPVLFEPSSQGRHRFDVDAWLKGAKLSVLDHAIGLGAQDHIACRLIAIRLPHDVVNARRRQAHRQAQQKGRTLSKQTQQRLAWNLFITNVPPALWAPQTVATVYRLRWQVELVFKSWKRYLHVASINTQKAIPTLCYLYARMLLIVLVYALSPTLRQTLWGKTQRELSVLKMVPYFQAFADAWMQAIFDAELALYRFLQRACSRAERLVTKASRKRRTTVQLINDRFNEQPDAVDSVNLMITVNA